MLKYSIFFLNYELPFLIENVELLLSENICFQRWNVLMKSNKGCKCFYGCIHLSEFYDMDFFFGITEN